jgi:hypothetical protein
MILPIEPTNTGFKSIATKIPPICSVAINPFSLGLETTRWTIKGRRCTSPWTDF